MGSHTPEKKCESIALRWRANKLRSRVHEMLARGDGYLLFRFHRFGKVVGLRAHWFNDNSCQLGDTSCWCLKTIATFLTAERVSVASKGKVSNINLALMDF